MGLGGEQPFKGCVHIRGKQCADSLVILSDLLGTGPKISLIMAVGTHSGVKRTVHT